MGWRDFQASVPLEFMESMELIVSGATSLIPLNPLIPFINLLESEKTPVLSKDTDWRPEPRAWLTDTSELRTRGVFEDLAGEIIRLTPDNLPLQKKLLRECCGAYSGPPWKHLVEDWHERAAIMTDTDMTCQEAELAAAKLLRIEAFLPELRETTI